MATSANVIEYDIYKGDERVGHFRKHMMCRLPEYNELLKYQPLEDHTIVTNWYDEEEEYNESDPVNLKDFLQRHSYQDATLKLYFKPKHPLEQLVLKLEQLAKLFQDTATQTDVPEYRRRLIAGAQKLENIRNNDFLAGGEFDVLLDIVNEIKFKNDKVS